MGVLKSYRSKNDNWYCNRIEVIRMKWNEILMFDCDFNGNEW